MAKFALAFAAIALAVACSLVDVVEAAGACKGVVVPAYFDSPSLWSSAVSAAKSAGVPIIMIANPDSGPGSEQDANYVEVIANAKSNGAKVIGYVATGYGNPAERPLAKIKSDIDSWYEFYPNVDGIFFDEVETEKQGTLSAHYQPVVSHLKSKKPNAYVMLNPGTNVQDEGFMKIANNVVNFESPLGSYAKWKPEPWNSNYSAGKFSHMVLNVGNAAGMKTALKSAAGRNAGYVFVTNDNVPNPYDTIPSYWKQEMAAVKAGCI